MKLIVLLLLTFSFSLFSKESKDREPASTHVEEVSLPDTVDISKDIIEINKTYIRDIASGEEKDEDLSTDRVEFWSFED